MNPEIRNVFISHVHEDDALLKNLKDLLGKAGYEIRDASIDKSKPNEAKNPDYIKSQILAPHIQWASTVIVLISPQTHTSEWVDWEIEYAAKQGKRIVGVYAQGAGDADIPKGLEQYGDAVVGWNSESVIDAISGKNNTWVTADGKPRPIQSIPRFKCS